MGAQRDLRARDDSAENGWVLRRSEDAESRSVPVRGGATETILGAAIRAAHAAMLCHIQKYFGMRIPQFHGIGWAM